MRAGRERGRVYAGLLGVVFCIVAGLPAPASSSAHIECQALDGAEGDIVRASVDDDFCECRDGKDEPNTSACSHLRLQFTCNNKGAKMVAIFSSRVRDGICDCCDGSDEAPGACADTCAEEGAAYRQELKERIQTITAGSLIRKEYAERGKRLLGEALEKRAGLEKQIADLRENQLPGAEKQLGAAKERSAALEKQSTEASMAEAQRRLRLNDVSVESLRRIVVEVATAGGTQVQNALVEALRTELYPSAGGDSSSEAYPLPSAQAVVRGDSTETTAPDAVPSASASGNLDEASRIVQDLERENAPPETETGGAADKARAVGVFEEFQESAQSAAVGSGDEVTEATNRVSEVKGDISRLERELSGLPTDNGGKKFGAIGEWRLFKLEKKCFNKRAQGYTYNICLFGSASQDSVDLGSWDERVWGDNSFEDPHAPVKARFSNGRRCHTGPMRSLDVDFVCATEDAVLDVSEPSMCEYYAKVGTPAVCVSSVADKLSAELNHDGSEL